MAYWDFCPSQPSRSSVVILVAPPANHCAYIQLQLNLRLLPGLVQGFITKKIFYLALASIIHAFRKAYLQRNSLVEVN